MSSDSLGTRSSAPAEKSQQVPGVQPQSPSGFVSLAQVPRREVGFLWPGWIPADRITFLDGDPGLGKSTILLDLAARLTGGLPLPDGQATHPGDVILLT